MKLIAALIHVSRSPVVKELRPLMKQVIRLNLTGIEQYTTHRLIKNYESTRNLSGRVFDAAHSERKEDLIQDTTFNLGV